MNTRRLGKTGLFVSEIGFGGEWLEHHPEEEGIAMINKFYDLATMQPEVPATIQSHYELLGHTASECIGCHACEARCPFGVPIARRMEQAAALFGR